MRVDQNGAQAFHAKALDEAHAAHIGRKIVDLDSALADALAVVLDANVQAKNLHAGNVKIPFI